MKALFFCHGLVYYGKTFRLTLKPSSVEKTDWCYARFKIFLKMKRCACCMRVTRENLSACKAFVDFWDDHLIIPSVRVFLQTSKPPEKAADGNVPHARRLQRFQNPYDDDAREHGTQVWSYGRTSEQPFCAQKCASSVLFRSGHSIQNRIDCNWFCTLFQMKDGRFYPAAWVEEKDICMTIIRKWSPWVYRSR